MRFDPLRQSLRQMFAAQCRPACALGVMAVSLAGVAPAASAALFPAEFELSSLLNDNGGTGRDGFVLEGDHVAGGAAGMSVAGAQDINGDGIDDLIVGSYRRRYADYASGSYVLFGTNAALTGALPAELNLADWLTDQRPGGLFLIGTTGEGAYSPGANVAMVEDINGDGIGEIVVGEPGPISAPTQEDIRKAFVLFGRDSTVGVEFPQQVSLPSLLGTGGDSGFAGTSDNGDYYSAVGFSSSSAGDINGDGLDDLLIGAPQGYSGYTRSGVVYVVFGRDTTQGAQFLPVLPLSSLLDGDGSEGFGFLGISSGDRLGFSTSAIGDINGDGLDDVILGAPHGDPGGRFKAGESYVIFGRATTKVGNFPARFELSSLATGDGSTGFVLNGADDDGNSGYSVSSAGDVNGDGRPDLIIGAPGHNTFGQSQTGKAYVVFGRHVAQTGNFSAEFELASLESGDGSDGFVLTGIAANDAAGTAVGSLQDVNADGTNDLFIGAHKADPGGRGSAGQTYVVFGRESGGFAAEFNLASLLASNGGDGSAGFVLNGVSSGDESGRSVAAAGDINDDGNTDIIIGATGVDFDTFGNIGAAYVVYGRSDGDGDGTHDAADNCLTAANPDQRDTDADGIGNLCDADLNNNCVISFGDLAIMKAVFFTEYPDADLNGDGSVNFADLGSMKQLFFETPGPAAEPNLCST